MYKTALTATVSIIFTERLRPCLSLHLAGVYCIIDLGDFMKNTFKYSAKLFLSLLFVAFAGIMLAISFAVIFAKSPKWVMLLFLELCGVTILITMIWQTVYDIGFKDSNMVRTGHMKENLYRGFIIGGIAQIPFALALILFVVFNLKFSIYRFINSVYFWFLTVIAGSGADKALGMRELGVGRITLMFLLLLVVPAISGGVYILGYKGIDLFSKFVYKKRKE